VNVRATLWGRWRAYGDVELQTAGSDSTVVFPRIVDPDLRSGVIIEEEYRRKRAALLDAL
jgi:hypothetical protein